MIARRSIAPLLERLLYGARRGRAHLDEVDATGLSSASARPGERRLAAVLIFLSVAGFAAIIPFARVRLLPVPTFIPIYEAALAVNDLVTAALLFGQRIGRGSRALLVLGCGYVFDAFIMVPHALSFPGAFSESGLLAAGPQSTAWLYMFWHGGFPVFVGGYALLAEREAVVMRAAPDGRWTMAAALALTLGAALALSLLATLGQDALPPIMVGHGYAPSMTLVISCVWLLSLLALVLLWRRASPSVLDLWLIVVMCAWVFDVGLSAVFNAGRFDLGFYAGRVYGLGAASFVLIVLLLETKGLHQRLALAAERIRDHARELERRVTERTAELAQSNAKLALEVGERQRAGEELQQVRRFLDVVIENIPATLVVKEGKDRRYVLINRAAEEVIGHGRDDVVGKTVYDLYPRAEADEIDALDRAALSRAGEPSESKEITVTTRRGPRMLRATTVPVLDDHGAAQYVLAIAEDITESRQTQLQLHRAQKMEAIGNLTGGMAHDFNNLLGVIIGNLDMLRGLVASHGTVAELASEALDAALRGADLTCRLLAFARRQPLKPARLDPNALVQDITRLLARTLGEQIELSVRPNPAVWSVIADPAQLESALTNLATNARDAMPKGGVLTIATDNRHLDPDYASLHPELAPGDYAMIEVSDTGCGMSREVLARVFEPFFTTKELGKGTGLGLSMVFGFVKQSGGHINVYSEPGIGTTFRLYLPRAEAPGAERVAALAATPQGAKGETVLVVEDNPSMRRIALRQLRELGYRTLEAENGAEALALLESERADLLFSDVVMPGGMSGVDLACEALTRWPRLRVVLTSGFPDLKVANAAAAPAPIRLLSKPYRRADLARMLREALEV